MNRFVHKEIAIQKSLKHEHVVDLLSSFENTRYVFMILTMCANSSIGELLEIKEVLSLKETRYVIYQTLLGLSYIHSQNIIHMDIKPDNVLLDINMQVKVGDFGLAMKADDENAKTRMAGTLSYMAPEIIGKEGALKKSDIWSLAVMAYELLFGDMPFSDENRFRLQTKILQGSYR